MKFEKSILVVGAGFSGSVIARILAENGYKVKLIDRREHIGGNAYDYVNEHGIRVHKYGPHIFHTNNATVVDWLSQFTEWVEYEHKVKAQLANGDFVTLPPNIETAEKVGKENIIDIFFRPYTKKMWGLDIEDLDPSILNRVPIRSDHNELYFPNDKFQLMPKYGYTHIFNNMLDHQNIDVHLNVSYDAESSSHYTHIFNSMPIDEYFDYRFGELPYRSIKFHHINLPMAQVLPVPTVNFTNDGPYTRITEWKNYPNHGQSEYFTTLTYEEPCDYCDNNMERYYPVKDVDGINRAKYNQYRELQMGNMTFIGRCGLYVYVDMHQAISSAMATARNFLKEV
jgi:UDP-galactopyranose mutase